MRNILTFLGEPSRLDGAPLHSVSVAHDVMLQDSGCNCELFRYLLICSAELSHHYRDCTLFFRGQWSDFKENGRTILKPSIFRGASGRDLALRFERTARAKELLRQYAKEEQIPYRESLDSDNVAEAILQHYEICPTHWLDVTDSPTIAAYFALQTPKSGEMPNPIVYVFALPQPSVNGLRAIKLSAECPPGALRPHFQRAFAITKVIAPTSPDEERYSEDLAGYLIGKFLIGSSVAKAEFQMFFGRPTDRAIYPNKIDPLAKAVQKVVESLQKT